MPLKHNKLNKIYSLFLYSALVLFSYQQPLYADVLTSVNDWAKAWASQNVDQYFESYAEDFVPSQEHTKKTWKSQRESRLLSPSFIKVTLSNIEISQHSEDFADVLFTQNYKSDSYSDEVTKQLRMQKIDDKWLIIKEKTIKIRQKTELQLVKKNEVLEDTTTVQIEHDVKEALNSWSKVWSSQDIDGYFAAYAEDFLPSNISNKKKWKKQRHNRVISPSYIKVTLTDVKITQHSKNNVDVVFNQNYESSNHSDDVRKLISMRRENERWLITKERVKKVLTDIREDLSSQDKTLSTD